MVGQEKGMWYSCCCLPWFWWATTEQGLANWYDQCSQPPIKTVRPTLLLSVGTKPRQMASLWDRNNNNRLQRPPCISKWSSSIGDVYWHRNNLALSRLLAHSLKRSSFHIPWNIFLIGNWRNVELIEIFSKKPIFWFFNWSVFCNIFPSQQTFRFQLCNKFFFLYSLPTLFTLKPILFTPKVITECWSFSHGAKKGKCFEKRNFSLN